MVMKALNASRWAGWVELSVINLISLSVGDRLPRLKSISFYFFQHSGALPHNRNVVHLQIFQSMATELGTVDCLTVSFMVERYVKGQYFHHVSACR